MTVTRKYLDKNAKLYRIYRVFAFSSSFLQVKVINPSGVCVSAFQVILCKGDGTNGIPYNFARLYLQVNSAFDVFNSFWIEGLHSAYYGENKRGEHNYLGP